MQKWFALLDTGVLKFVGIFDSFHSADEALDSNYVWLICENDAKQFLEELRNNL